MDAVIQALRLTWPLTPPTWGDLVMTESTFSMIPLTGIQPRPEYDTYRTLLYVSHSGQG